MHKTFSLILITLILASFTVHAEENSDFSRMAGKYVGEVFNGNDMDPVVTTFFVTPDGRLKGNYVAEDEIEIVDGTISNAFNVEGRTYSFEWTDKYGEGIAVLVFSEDYNSFTGYWTDSSGSTEQPWSGTRQ